MHGLEPNWAAQKAAAAEAAGLAAAVGLEEAAGRRIP